MRRRESESDVSADGLDDMVLSFQLRRRGGEMGVISSIATCKERARTTESGHASRGGP